MEFKLFRSNKGKISLGITLDEKIAIELGTKIKDDSKISPLSYQIYYGKDTEQFRTKYNLVISSTRNDKNGIKGVKKYLEYSINKGKPTL